MRNLIIFILLVVTIFASVAHSNNDVTFKLVGSHNASAGILSTDVQIGFEILFNDVLIKTGEKVDISVYENFNKVESLFVENEEFSGFYCSSVEFLQSKIMEQVDKERLISATYNDRKARKILVVVKIDSGIRSISDLLNKDITYGQSNDLVELYLNTLAIKNNNSLAKSYFKTINNKLNGSESLVSLYFGNTDVAVVYDDEYALAIELNPQLKNDLIIIEESPHVVNAVVGLRKSGINTKTRDTFRKVALEMHEHKKGRKMLSMYGAKKFEAIRLEDLIPVEKMLTTYNEFLGKE